MATGTYTFRYIEADIAPSLTIAEYRRRRAPEGRARPVERLRRYMRDLYDMEGPARRR